MIVTSDRTAMDRALGDAGVTVLLLRGAADSPAARVHDFALEHEYDPPLECFLVADPALLSASEKTLWFGWTAEDRYAIVAGEERLAHEQGKIADLLRADGKPSIAALKKAIDAVT